MIGRKRNQGQNHLKLTASVSRIESDPMVQCQCQSLALADIKSGQPPAIRPTTPATFHLNGQ